MRSGTKEQITNSIVLLGCFLALGAGPALAQRVADVARQERARQRNLPHPATHIYTNEDFERSQILVPEDRHRFEAERKDGSPVLEPEAGDTTAGATRQKEAPLGDVARHFRLLKELQEIQEADWTDVLPGTKPALASPSLTRPAMVTVPKLHGKAWRTTDQPEWRQRVTSGEAGKVLINKGDSLWKLARRYLGNGTRWHEFLAANPQLKDPNRIRAGQWIRLPMQGFTSVAGKIRVRKGDTMWKLAQSNFGSGLAWSCIAGANPAIPNVNRIYSGQVLNLPARCAPAR